jgi:VanZ family protein
MVLLCCQMIPGTAWKRLHHAANSPIAMIPLLLYMGFIYRLSDGPAPPASHSVPDWILHGTCYFIFFFLGWVGIHGVWPAGTTRHLLIITFILTTLYGMSDEWHQSFVPSRHASLTDIGYDICGAVVGLILAGILSRRSQLEGDPK